MFKFFPYKDCQVLAHRGLYNCYGFLTMVVHLPYNVKCQKVNAVVNACYINKADFGIAYQVVRRTHILYYYIIILNCV